MTGTLPTPPADYSLGVDEAERARLIAQCAMHRPEAEHLLDRIGIGAGGQALDMGCGPLGVLDLLVDRVGGSGRVVGLDRDPGLLAAAVRTMNERGVDTVELIEADAARTGLPDAAFDLVHERLVLVNVPHPADVVAEMTRLARPGGWVVMQDVDWISCVPAHPDWSRLTAAAAAAWSGDVHIGRALPMLLRDAGLEDIGVDAHVRVFRHDEPYHRLLPRFVEIHRERIVAGGAWSANDLDGCLRRLRDHLDDPSTYTLYATLVQAWGRKP